MENSLRDWRRFGVSARDWRWPAALLLAVCLGAAGSAATLRAAPAGTVTVPLVRTNFNHYGLEMLVDGHPALVTLDTGAPLTTFSEQFCQKYLSSSETQAIPAGVVHLSQMNGQAARMGWVQDLKAGSMEFGSGPIALTKFPSDRGFGTRSRLPFAGVLGADILAKYNAVIDWSGRRVYFGASRASQAGIGKAAMSHGWTAIPMEYTNGRHFAVPCTLGGSYHLIVDTGAAFTLIDKSIWGNEDITRGRPRTYVDSLNDTMAVSPVLLKHWSIGQFPMEHSAVAVGNLKGTIYHEFTPSAGRVVGLLGSEWLAFRSAIIDIDGMTLYLKKPTR